jgi:hypothetical protein
VEPEHVDAAMKLTEEKIIPGYQAHPGFRGYILLTEPGGGEHAIAITLWDNEENMTTSGSRRRTVIPGMPVSRESSPTGRRASSLPFSEHISCHSDTRVRGAGDGRAGRERD